MIYISLPFVVREVSTFKLCHGQLGCLLKLKFPLSKILTQSRAQFKQTTGDLTRWTSTGGAHARRPITPGLLYLCSLYGTL